MTVILIRDSEERCLDRYVVREHFASSDTHSSELSEFDDVDNDPVCQLSDECTTIDRHCNDFEA